MFLHLSALAYFTPSAVFAAAYKLSLSEYPSGILLLLGFPKFTARLTARKSPASALSLLLRQNQPADRAASFGCSSNSG